MRRWVFLAGIVVLLLLITPVLMVAAVLGGVDQTTTAAAACSTATGNAPAAAVQLSQLDPQQQINAGIIIAEGRSMGVSDQGLVIALATARQEEDLHNDLVPNDHDSVGLFQQRPSQGWGTAAQVGDPHYSSQKFYKALLAVPGWEGMAVTDAAQRVQRSATPTAYAKWEGLARAILGAAGGSVTSLTPVACTTTSNAAYSTASGNAILDLAQTFVGTPYLYGGSAPGGFDCSGLTSYVYLHAAGKTLPRTAAGQQVAAQKVTDPQPGDLVFFGTPAGHVGLVIDGTAGMMLDAPNTGALVRIESYRGWHDLAGFGRF